MPPKHVQKNLTVMFTDISGFTRHTETISRDALMARLESHNALLMPLVAHFEGKLVKTIGDAFLITFESPTNAVQCGMLVQHRLREFNAGKPPADQIHVKISVNVGEVSVTEDDVFGDPVNVASKIEKATLPDEIYFTEAVFLAMNKAEVPNTFVRMFRPKGIESQEIKLYRVVQDEDDLVYRHVIDGVHIDEEATKARAFELSSTASKEARRHRDTIEHLVEGQRRSTRTLLVALMAGLVVLGAGAYFGLKALTGSGDEAEKQTAAGVRTYLAAGKPVEAMGVIDAHAAAHGSSDTIDRLRTEVATAVWTVAKAAAEDASLKLAAGDGDSVCRVEEPRTTAMPGPAVDVEAVRESIRLLRARAAALDRAKERLEAGDVEAARKSVAEAAGPHAATGGLKALADRADVLASARTRLTGKDAEDGAAAVVSTISAAYGDDTTDRAALDELGRALALELAALAKKDGRATALARREEMRIRFKNFTNWRLVDREIDLASLWEYVGPKRNAWRDAGEDVQSLFKSLRSAGNNDPEFLYRFAMTLHGVQRARDEIGILGMAQLEAAIGADLKLLDRHDVEIRAVIEYWLGEDQVPSSYGRRLARTRYYDALKPKLLANLEAMTGEGADAKPDLTARANAFAILMDHGEKHVVKDPIQFLDVMLPAFVEGSMPALSLEHAKTWFAEFDDREVAIRVLSHLEGEYERAKRHEGPFGASTDAVAHLRELLHEFHPVHGALVDGQPNPLRRR